MEEPPFPFNLDEDELDELSTESSSSSDSQNRDPEALSEYGFITSKLKLPENIAAYYEKRELIRETKSVSCDDNLVQNVMLNYIIVKKILSSLCWQARLLCKHVCSTWRSAVNALAKEQITPVDFLFEVNSDRHERAVDKYKKSGNFYNEPLATFIFANDQGMTMSTLCEDILPPPCSPHCRNATLHSLIDVVQRQASAPKDCTLTVTANYLTYLPLPQSCTYPYSRRRNHMRHTVPFIGGINIPVLPNVEFHVINIKQKSRNSFDVQKDFYDVIDKLVPTRVFKGVLVYVTEKYILQSVEDIIFLNYLKEVQPDIPYALGGCIVEETMHEQSDINNLIQGINAHDTFFSENLLSIGLFTVPKITDADEQVDTCNFDMYSVVVESSEWSKAKIQEAVTEFANKVPHFEHSVAVKLSCVGRDQKHEQEQDCFRTVFPNTPIVGCYGNGELGINHPPRPPRQCAQRHKRRRTSRDSRGIMYSYSTVFVYIGWGRITREPPETT